MKPNLRHGQLKESRLEGQAAGLGPNMLSEWQGEQSDVEGMMKEKSECNTMTGPCKMAKLAFNPRIGDSSSLKCGKKEQWSGSRGVVAEGLKNWMS